MRQLSHQRSAQDGRGSGALLRVVGALWALALLITLGANSSAAAVAPEIVVVGTSLSDNGDDDGWADTSETVTMRLYVRNLTGIDLTGVYAVLSTADPSIGCVSRNVLPIGALALDAEVLTDEGFEFQMAAIERSAPFETLSAEVTVAFFSDVVGFPVPQSQTLTLDLDLDAAGGAGPTTYFEGFEDGFGSFTTMHLDEHLNPPASDIGNMEAGVAAALGARCQYSNPGWEIAASHGNSQGNRCYPNPDGLDDRFFFDVTDLRAHGGLSSMYFGFYLDEARGFTTPTAQVEAVRTTNPVNLAWSKTCSFGAPIACVDDADCVEGGACGYSVPTLSFKQQVSFMDHRSVSAQQGKSADMGVVQVQLAGPGGENASDWIKVYPFVNRYDSQANSNYFNCSFDPIDDGNTEQDFFDPSDPIRSLGPSSTCSPEFNFVDQGDTFLGFDADEIGDASHGPGLEGSVGVGTWIEPEVSLSQYRGRRLRIRFLTTGLKLGNVLHWENAFAFNPDPSEDGWFIDDVTVTHALVTPAGLAVDTKDNSLLVTLDDDGDLLTCDNCPFDPNPGQEDQDGDGVGDACDLCPLEIVDDQDGDGWCCPEDNCCAVENPSQGDQDGDGVGDACDNCPTVANADQSDAVHPNGIGDACDDPDGDGVVDAEDNCSDLNSTDLTDTDGDGVGDLCDNCALVPTVDQDDTDGDGIGDACDSCIFVANTGDVDFDGIDDGCDICILVGNPDQADFDGDGVGDACDNCPLLPEESQDDGDLDGIGDACDPCPGGDFSNDSDADGDGVICAEDNCPEVANVTQFDSDGDGQGEACDACPTDADNDKDLDGVCGNVDNCVTGFNSDQERSITLLHRRTTEYQLAGDRVISRVRFQESSSTRHLFSVPLQGGVPLQLAPPLGIVNDVFDFEISPDQQSILYLTDSLEDDRFKLYRVPAVGGEAIEMGGPLLPGGRVRDFAWTPDGESVIYSAIQDQLGTEELYRAPATGGPGVRLHPPFRTGVTIPAMAVTRDGQRVLFITDNALDGVPELYSVDVGGGTPTRLSAPLSADPGVSQFQLTLDGSMVVYRAGDGGPAFGSRLFAVPVEGGAVTSLSRNGHRARQFEITADGRYVVYSTQTLELFTVPIQGGMAKSLVGPEPGVSVFRFAVTPDGATVVINAGGPLYKVPASGGAATLLSEGPYLDVPVVTPDGATVLALAAVSDNIPLLAIDFETGERFIVNADLTEDQDVRPPLLVTPDSRSVVYITDLNGIPQDLRRTTLSFDPDVDADGVLAVCDVCPDSFDPAQVDIDGDGVGAVCDCDDTQAAVFPGATEINDGIDNQCTGDDGFGLIDEIGGDTTFGPMGDKDLVVWRPQLGAINYQVARSTEPGFSVNVATFVTDEPSFSDATQPASGVTLFYLARPLTPSPGSWGADSDGTERTVP